MLSELVNPQAGNGHLIINDASVYSDIGFSSLQFPGVIFPKTYPCVNLCNTSFQTQKAQKLRPHLVQMFSSTAIFAGAVAF